MGGAAVDETQLLALCPVPPSAVFRHGDMKHGRVRSQTGVNVGVSVADFSDLPQQISDACTFLRTHMLALEALRALPGLTHASLDFAVERRDVFAQTDAFPAELLQLLAQLRCELALTQYEPAA